MLTTAQRQVLADSFAAVSAALGAIARSGSVMERLVSKCGGGQGQAIWWVACYLGKPSRIPAHFGSVLTMSDECILAAGIVSEHAALLHTVLSQKVIHRLNNIELGRVS